MYTLEITDSAESDLDQITDYLGTTLANPQAAISFLDELNRVSLMLGEMPGMYPLCADPRLAELGYRKAIVRAYILIYEIDEPAKTIRVLRFFHESENYSSKL